MKFLTLIIVVTFLLMSSPFAQAFRTGLDKRDASSSGGIDQRTSFQYNAVSSLNNSVLNFSLLEKDSLQTETQNRFYACAYGILNYLKPYYSKESAENLIDLKGGFGVLLGYRLIPNVCISSGIEYNFLKTVSIEKDLNIFGEQWKRTREYTLFSLPIIFSLTPRKNWKISPELSAGISFENLIKNSRISCTDNFGCQTAIDFINGDWTLSYRVGVKANVKINQRLGLVSGIDFIKQNQSFESAYVSGSAFVLKTIRLCFGLKISI